MVIVEGHDQTLDIFLNLEDYVGLVVLVVDMPAQVVDLGLDAVGSETLDAWAEVSGGLARGGGDVLETKACACRFSSGWRTWMRMVFVELDNGLGGGRPSFSVHGIVSCSCAGCLAGERSRWSRRDVTAEGRQRTRPSPRVLAPRLPATSNDDDDHVTMTSELRHRSTEHPTPPSPPHLARSFTEDTISYSIPDDELSDLFSGLNLLDLLVMIEAHFELWSRGLRRKSSGWK